MSSVQNQSTNSTSSKAKKLSDDSNLSEFRSALHDWTQKIRAGELTARIPVDAESENYELFQEINFVAEMLESLSRDAETQLQHHTEHIAQKNKSLATLYDVVTSINMSRDLHDLLSRFLHTMTELVDARAATVYLETKKNTCTLIAEIGLDSTFQEKHPYLPKNMSDSKSNQTIPVDIIPCPEELNKNLFNKEKLSILIVPLQYRGKILGVYKFFIEADKKKENND